MKTILWHQSKIIGTKDIIVIDGVVSEYEGKTIQDEAFKKLVSGREWHEYYSVPTLRKFDDSISSQLHIYFNSFTNETMIQTHFVDQDEKGRRIPIMFYTVVDGIPDDVVKVLVENARSVGMTLSVGDIKVVGKALDFFLKKKRILKISIIATAIITISALLICGASK